MTHVNVAVLLAAYNGSKWVKQQIDSILKQSHVNVHIYISVDKSDDDTFELCKAYAEQDHRLTVLDYGERFGGAGPNFYRLIRDVDFSKYDYISFSDQDDIWFENKLYTSICNIISSNAHAYSSNIIAFWEDGRKCLIDKAQKQVKYDYLFEAAGPGCTYVLTNELCNSFKKFYLMHSDEVGKVTLHDWMIYAYARNRGFKWIIDKQPSMLYRQHANNQVGANNSIRSAAKRSKKVFDRWYAGEIIKIIVLLEMDKSSIGKHLINGGFFDNVIFAFQVNKLRRRFRDRFALFIFCLAGLIRM
jgi:rhamnosyltransferase